MKNKTIQMLFALVLATLAGTVVKAAIDRSPPLNMAGAGYYSSPSTLVNGDYDVLHTDNAHNLFVNVRAGGGASPGTTSPTPINQTASNGVTPATLVAASGSLRVIPWSLTVLNTDTVTHRVRLLTSTGPVAIEVVNLVPNGFFIYDGSAAAFAWRTLAGDALQIDLPNFVAEGGTGTTVLTTGYYTTQ